MGESVEGYAKRFRKLAGKLGNDITEIGKAGAFMRGLLPAIYHGGAILGDQSTLNKAIESAKRAEINVQGYMQQMIPNQNQTSGNFNNRIFEDMQKGKSGNDVDKLAEQISKMALSIERMNRGNNNYRNYGNNNYGNGRNNNAGIVCYNCGKEGHIKPYCPDNGNNNRNNENNKNNGNNRNNNGGNNGRSLNLLRATHEEENALEFEYSSTDEDEDERILFPITRSGREYRAKPETENEKKARLQKAKKTKKKNNLCGKCGKIGHFANECEQKQCGYCGSMNHSSRNCKKKPTEDEKFWNQRKNKKRSTIEVEGTLEDINFEAYISSLPSKLSIGQVMKLAPEFEGKFYEAVRKSHRRSEENTVNVNSLEKDLNLIEQHENQEDYDEKDFVSLKCNTYIEGKEVETILDTGANVCAMTMGLIEKLNLEIDGPSDIVVKVASGKRYRSLGRIDRVYFLIGKMKAFVGIEVIESGNDEMFILETNWLKRVKSNLNLKENVLTIKEKGGYTNISVKCVDERSSLSDDDDEEEYETETLREARF